jgi:hypothetical protein
MIGIEGAAGEYAAQRLRVCPGRIAGTVAVIDCPLPALRCEATGASNVAI